MTLTVNTKTFPRWAVAKLIEDKIIRFKDRCTECETYEVLKDIVVHNQVVAKVGYVIKRVFNRKASVDDVKLYELNSIFTASFFFISMFVVACVYLVGELIDKLF